MTGIVSLNDQMTRISDNWSKSGISTFSGETAGNNTNNLWFAILNSWQNLIWIEESLSINGIKLRCCQDNTLAYCCCPTRTTITTKPIQSPFAPIKPREYLNYHQVETWKLKCTRWNQTTEKPITPRFDILDSVQIDNLPNVCSVLIVFIQCKLITCQIFFLYW